MASKLARYNLSQHKSIIVSNRQPTLSAPFYKLLENEKPLGVILFNEDIKNKNKGQIKFMTDILHKYVPFILVDQEGGNVMRLQGPEFYNAPRFRDFGNFVKDYGIDAAKEEIYKNAKLIGQDLNDCGIDVNCAPVLDLHDHKYDENNETDPTINKEVNTKYDENNETDPTTNKENTTKHVISSYQRAISSNPEIVAKLGESFCQGLLDMGITPIVKHFGHGRSTGYDPHHGISRVKLDLTTFYTEDLYPFKYMYKKFNNKIAGMPGHFIVDEIDDSQPGVFTEKFINDVIREDNEFKGFLITDAIEMKGLPGTIEEKITKTLNAGMDAVLCGVGEEQSYEAIKFAPTLRKDSIKRLTKLSK